MTIRVCCRCHHLINDDHSRGKLYEGDSKDLTHGFCLEDMVLELEEIGMTSEEIVLRIDDLKKGVLCEQNKKA